jgi:Holliday junction resolvase RusA-like endonuclease
MTDTFEVWIPGNAPGVNHYVVHTRTGAHYMTPRARDWLEAAKAMVWLAGYEQHWLNPQTAYTFAVSIEHTCSRQDVDGPVKVILDAVAQGLGFDDKRVSSLSVKRIVGPPRGARVRVWALEPMEGER